LPGACQPSQEDVFGNSSLTAQIGIDIDRSLMTGFTYGNDLHNRFGMDYLIEITAGGFGETSNGAELRYWRHKSEPPFVTLDKVQVVLGDWFYPNGSVLVVGTDPTYGTDRHQIFLRVPRSLFNDGAFPVCSSLMPSCIQDRFPCPLNLTPNLETSFFCVRVKPFIDDSEDTRDYLPDSGAIDAGTGQVVPPFPAGTQDLVASVSDPADEVLGGTGINGEELISFKAFKHEGGVLAFELGIDLYTGEDTAYYEVLFDLDNNSATGYPYQNGSQTIGVDFIAEFQNFDNPVGELDSELAGTLGFWLQGNEFCTLWPMDYLARHSYGHPGYVWFALPPEFIAPYLAANTSGRIKAIAAATSPDVLNFSFDDVAPNHGALEIPIGPATPPPIHITSIVPQTSGQQLAIRFVQTGGGTAAFAVRTASSVMGPWSSEHGAAITPLGGGLYEAIIPVLPQQARGFYRIVGTP
jgi:hypothetical protein